MTNKCLQKKQVGNNSAASSKLTEMNIRLVDEVRIDEQNEKQVLDDNQKSILVSVKMPATHRDYGNLTEKETLDAIIDENKQNKQQTKEASDQLNHSLFVCLCFTGMEHSLIELLEINNLNKNETVKIQSKNSVETKVDSINENGLVIWKSNEENKDENNRYDDINDQQTNKTMSSARRSSFQTGSMILINKYKVWAQVYKALSIFTNIYMVVSSFLHEFYEEKYWHCWLPTRTPTLAMREIRQLQIAVNISILIYRALTHFWLNIDTSNFVFYLASELQVRRREIETNSNSFVVGEKSVETTSCNYNKRQYNPIDDILLKAMLIRIQNSTREKPILKVGHRNSEMHKLVRDSIRKDTIATAIIIVTLQISGILTALKTLDPIHFTKINPNCWPDIERHLADGNITAASVMSPYRLFFTLGDIYLGVWFWFDFMVIVFGNIVVVNVVGLDVEAHLKTLRTASNNFRQRATWRSSSIELRQEADGLLMRAREFFTQLQQMRQVPDLLVSIAVIGWILSFSVFMYSRLNASIRGNYSASAGYVFYLFALLAAFCFFTPRLIQIRLESLKLYSSIHAILFFTDPVRHRVVWHNFLDYYTHKPPRFCFTYMLGSSQISWQLFLKVSIVCVRCCCLSLIKKILYVFQLMSFMIYNLNY